MLKHFERRFVGDLCRRMADSGRPRRLQILIGPRQVGKTWGAQQIMRQFEEQRHLRCRYATADQFAPPGPEWLASEWEAARKEDAGLLVVDEVQKVTRWSEAVKAQWEKNPTQGHPFHVLLLGSSSLLMQRGLNESLAGRFEMTRCGHWSWGECREAFGWDLERWLFFGGYPGLAQDVEGCARDWRREVEWRRLVQDSMIEPVVGRDVLQLQVVQKPALLRQLVSLVCQAPAYIVTYDKMVGQLSEAGNTTVLAHYLNLLDGAFLCTGLAKFSRGVVRQRASSPKLIVQNNAMVSALNAYRFPGNRQHWSGEDEAEWKAWRGRLVENAAGAHLLAFAREQGGTVTYWRDGPDEVDFVVESGKNLFAIEVKSGAPTKSSGFKAFLKRYPEALPVVVGGKDLSLEEFFDLDDHSDSEGRSGELPFKSNLLPRLLKFGLQERLGTPIEISRDYGQIAFSSPKTGKSCSLAPQELDAARLLTRLGG